MEGMVGPARRSEESALFFCEEGKRRDPQATPKVPRFSAAANKGGGWREWGGRLGRARRSGTRNPERNETAGGGGGVISREWREWSGEPGGVTERGGEEEVPRNNGRASQAERESALFLRGGEEEGPPPQEGALRNETMPFFLQPHQTERESVWGGKIGRGGTDHPGGTKGPPQEGAVRNETAAGGVISKNGAGGSGGARERPFFCGKEGPTTQPLQSSRAA